MRRLVAFGLVASATGCAAIIGADFDDAGLVQEAGPDVHEASVKDAIADQGKAFAPTDLPNLGIWLDAHQDVDLADASAAVTKWHDLSGHARDATPIFGGTNPPSYVATAINNQPAIEFKSAQLDLLSSSWVGPESTEVTMFIVTRGYPNSAIRFQSNINYFPFVIFPVDVNQSEADAGFVFDFGATQPNAQSLRVLIGSSPTFACARYNSDGTVDTFVNGKLSEQRITNVPLGSGTLYIGGAYPLLLYPYTTIPFADGDIGEIIVYENALTDVDRVKVESYLAVKWLIGP